MSQISAYPTLAQYILHRNKVPCDAFGTRINALDPANWMSPNAALSLATASGLGVGFVLTESDPYAVIDLDGCYDPATGTYSELAQSIAGVAPGALMELSQSGKGLHLWGRYTGDSRALRNRSNGAEFYRSARFIALGRYLGGSPDADITVAADFYIPRRTDPTTTVPALTSGQVTQAEVDKAIADLQMNFLARPLWNRNEEILAKAYPTQTPGKSFDNSAADQALCNIIAGIVGNNAELVKAVWLASPLAKGRLDRAKLTRADYVTNTVIRACEGKAGTAQPGTGTGTTRQSFMTILEQVTHFAGCVYVRSFNKVLLPDGSMAGEQAFNAYFGGYEFQMEIDGKRSTRKAWEAFTQNRIHDFPKVADTFWNPGLPFGTIKDDKVNRFRKPVVIKTFGDVSPFLDLLTRMIPDPRDRAIILSWCAALVQHHAIKFQWAIVLQGVEGNGKSLVARFIREAVGMDVTHMPNPEDMNEKYNGYIEENLLIVVEEIHMKGRRDQMDRLKKYITGDQIEVRTMGVDKRMVQNFTNWVFLTNFQDAIIKTQNDRRYAVFFTAQQGVEDLKRDGMDGDYFRKLWAWAQNGGFGDVAGYLSRIEIPQGLNPAVDCFRAPVTSSTADAIRASFGMYEQELLGAIESELIGFTGGWINTTDARTHIQACTGKSVSNRALGEALRNIGYVLHSSSRVRLPTGRATLYCLPENREKPHPHVISPQLPGNVMQFRPLDR